MRKWRNSTAIMRMRNRLKLGPFSSSLGLGTRLARSREGTHSSKLLTLYKYWAQSKSGHSFVRLRYSLYRNSKKGYQDLFVQHCPLCVSSILRDITCNVHVTRIRMPYLHTESDWVLEVVKGPSGRLHVW